MTNEDIVRELFQPQVQSVGNEDIVRELFQQQQAPVSNEDIVNELFRPAGIPAQSALSTVAAQPPRRELQPIQDTSFERTTKAAKDFFSNAAQMVGKGAAEAVGMVAGGVPQLAGRNMQQDVSREQFDQMRGTIWGTKNIGDKTYEQFIAERQGAGIDLNKSIGRGIESAGQTVSNTAQSVSNAIPLVGDYMSDPAYQDKVRHLPLTHPDRIAQLGLTMLRSAPSVAAAGVATAYGGLPAGAALMAAQGIGGAVQDADRMLANRNDLTPEQKLDLTNKYATTSAAISGLFSAIPMGKMVEASKLGRAGFTKWLSDQVVNVPSNTIGSIFDGLVRQRTIDPSMTGDDIKRNALETAFSTIGTTLATSSLLLPKVVKKEDIKFMYENQDHPIIAQYPELQRLAGETYPDYSARTSNDAYGKVLQAAGDKLHPLDFAAPLHSFYNKNKQAGDVNVSAAVQQSQMKTNVGSVLRRGGFGLKQVLDIDGNTKLAPDTNVKSLGDIVNEHGEALVDHVMKTRVLQRQDAMRNEIEQERVNLLNKKDVLEQTQTLLHGEMAMFPDPLKFDQNLLESNSLSSQLGQIKSRLTEIESRQGEGRYAVGKDLEQKLRGQVDAIKVDPLQFEAANRDITNLLTMAKELIRPTGRVSNEELNTWDQDIYSPLRRSIPKEQGGTGKFDPTKKLEGSSYENIIPAIEQLRDIVAFSVDNYNTEIGKQKTLSFLSKYAPNKVKSVGSDEGMSTRGIHTWEDGKKKFWKIDDPELAAAVSNMDVDKVDRGLMSVMALANRYVQKTMTSDPTFRALSGIRSLDEAFAQRKEWTTVVPAVAASWKGMRNKDLMNELEANNALFTDFIPVGEKGFDAWLDDAVKQKNIAQKALSAYHHIGMNLENFARVGTAKRILDAGGTMAEAVDGALNTGPNYSTEGNNKAFNEYVKTTLFGKAHTTGTNTWLKNVKDDPMGYIAKLTLRSAASTWLAMAAADRLLEDRKDPLKKTKFDPNLESPLGSQFSGPKLATAIGNIPLPMAHFEDKVGRVLPQMIVKYANGLAANGEAGQQFYNFLTSTVLGAQLPTVLNEPIQQFANYDTFQGHSIVSPYDVAAGKDSGLIKGPNQVTNAIGSSLPFGGMSGKRLDHMLRGTFGGWATGILAIGNAVTDLAEGATVSGENKKPDIAAGFGNMLLNRIVRTQDIPQTQYDQDYYTLKNIADNELAWSMALSKEEAKMAFNISRRIDLGSRVEMFKSFQKTIDANNEVIKAGVATKEQIESAKLRNQIIRRAAVIRYGQLVEEAIKKGEKLNGW